MIKIGIDPAFRTAGFCVCIIDGNDVAFKTFKNGLVDFVFWLIHDRPTEAVRIVVENSDLQKTTFGVPKNISQAEKDKRSRDVGKNQATSKYTVDFCISYFGAENVHGISPLQKGKKIECPKIFAGIVKSNGHIIHKKSTTQDERDAYMLAVHNVLNFR